MQNDYQKISNEIMNKRRFGKTSGCEVTREMTNHLGHPEKGMRIIHIAGTNGKGSTAAFVSSILQAAGFCVGQFTSPHLVNFTERIRVNGQEISQDDVVRLGQQVLSVPMELECTMFDLCLAMALLYFREKNCDFVVLEAGLGGRLDSTNGLGETAQVSVVTNIGFDHTQILGSTLAEIAGEKAGIFREGGNAVLGKMPPEAREVLVRRGQELGMDLYQALVEVDENDPAEDHSGEDICREDMCRNDIRWKKSTEGIIPVPLKQHQKKQVGLAGCYQLENAATAAAVYEVLWRENPELFRKKYTEEKDTEQKDTEDNTPGRRNETDIQAWKDAVLCQGLARASWPGRMETVSKDPFFLVDGAHNPQGVRALKESLQQMYPKERVIFVVGVLADKDYETMLSEMVPLAEKFYTVTVESSRSLQGQQVAQTLQSLGASAEYMADLQLCLKKVLKEGQASGKKTVAFGSLYFVGSIMGLLEKEGK